MRYSVLSQQEIEAQKPKLAAGPADFTVMSAKEKTSKKGNDMIELQLAVWDKNGLQGTVFDYLVNNAQFKIKGFWESVGLAEQYETGVFDCQKAIDTGGKLEIKIEKNEQYGDQPRVKYYLSRDETPKTDEPFTPDMDDPFA